MFVFLLLMEMSLVGPEGGADAAARRLVVPGKRKGSLGTLVVSKNGGDFNEREVWLTYIVQVATRDGRWGGGSVVEVMVMVMAMIRGRWVTEAHQEQSPTAATGALQASRS